MRDINSILATFHALKKINGENSVSVKELAKELSVKPSELMIYIEQEHKLFVTEMRTKTVTKIEKGRPFFGEKPYRYDTQYPLGMFICEVYTDAEQNYRTEEWLRKKIFQSPRYIYVSEYNNYGSIDGYFISNEKTDSAYRYHLWRNTYGKVSMIKDKFGLKPASYIVGGFGDCYTVKLDGFEISLEQINILKLEGWTTNDFSPLTIYK